MLQAEEQYKVQRYLDAELKELTRRMSQSIRLAASAITPNVPALLPIALVGTDSEYRAGLRVCSDVPRLGSCPRYGSILISKVGHSTLGHGLNTEEKGAPVKELPPPIL
jgi:hypothetical protein